MRLCRALLGKNLATLVGLTHIIRLSIVIRAITLALLIMCISVPRALASFEAIKNFHLDIQLVEKADLNLEANWKNICQVLASAWIPGKGPWNFGLFRSHSCYLGGNPLAGKEKQNDWQLIVRQTPSGVSIELYPPKKTGTLERSTASIDIPGGPGLIEALRTRDFATLMVAALVDQMTLVSQVTPENATALRSGSFKKANTVSGLPQLSENPVFFELHINSQTSQLRLKVIPVEHLDQGLRKAPSVWAGFETQRGGMQKKLQGLLNLYVVKKQKAIDDLSALAAARKATDAAKKAALEAEKAKASALLETQPSDENESLPSTRRFQVYTGYAPAGLLGSQTSLIEGGLHFGLSQGQSNGLRLGADFALMTQQKPSPYPSTEIPASVDLAQVNRVSLQKAWGGWAFGTEFESISTLLETEQGIGALQVQVTGVLPETQAATGLLTRKSLFPMYHIELSLSTRAGNFKARPFFGFETAIGGSEELSTLAAGLQTSWQLFVSQPAEAKNSPKESLGTTPEAVPGPGLEVSVFSALRYSRFTFEDLNPGSLALAKVTLKTTGLGMRLGALIEW